MSIALKFPLTFDIASLEPVLSRDAVRDHLMQFHTAACADAVRCVKGTALEPLSLESLIRLTPCLSGYERLFRRACRIRNHNLYWQSLHPGGGNTPWGPAADAIRDRFGTLGGFVERARHQQRVEIHTTEGEVTFPLGKGTVLLALDLWEHAYYADFRSHRDDYVAACLEKLMNWDFANFRLRSAQLHHRRARQESRKSAAYGTAKRLFPNHGVV